jgi:DNA-binding LytR/AlgR family response regulator
VLCPAIHAALSELLARPAQELARVVTFEVSFQIEGSRIPALQTQGGLRWITVQLGRERRLVTVEDICFLRADNQYVRVVTADGEAWISTPLKDLLRYLDLQSFWQVRRGTIVNVNAVRSVLRGVAGKLTLQLMQRSGRLELSARCAHRFQRL